MQTRPRKPTALKLVDGNPGNRKISDKEPKPDRGLPEKPSFLGPIAGAEWDNLGPKLAKIGLLTQVDGPLFAAYCWSFETWRLAVEDHEKIAAGDPTTHGALIKTVQGNAVLHPMRIAVMNALKHMLATMREIGLTPQARASLETEGGDGADDDDGFFT